MTRDLYRWMYLDSRSRIEKFKKVHGFDKIHLHCGGAAWADHLCVSIFKAEAADYMTMHMPTTFVSQYGRFTETNHVGSTANHYHERFSRVIGTETLISIAHVLLHPNVDIEVYDGFFKRNIGLGAQVHYLLAYTWGSGKAPKSRSGTLHCWKNSPAPFRQHVPLEQLKSYYENREKQQEQ
jgi:hypothetical protein